MLNKLHMQIKSLERHYGITQRVMILGTDDLKQCSDDKLKAYLEYLQNDDKEEPTQKADRSALSSVEPEPSEITSADIPISPIVAAPTIREVDPQEQELDELLAKLPDKQNAQIEWARKKGVPTKALLHASSLWLSDDPDDHCDLLHWSKRYSQLVSKNAYKTYVLLL